MSGSSPLFPPTIPISTNNALFLSLYSHLQQQLNDNQPSVSETNALKPRHSYIGLIAKAILSTNEKRMLLSEIYDWIGTNYSYFKFRGNGWRNSVRHNLSLNDCFVKEDRAPNGKGHYWTIHEANLFDFARGDFRRKHAQWKIKSHDIHSLAFQAHNQNGLFPCHNNVFKRSTNFDVNSLLTNNTIDTKSIDSI